MSSSKHLVHIAEPPLLFGHNQRTDDPRDGLTLFGPLDTGKPYGVRTGVVGTRDGVRWFSEWLDAVNRPVFNEPPVAARPFFPGFEAAFGIPWGITTGATIVLATEEIESRIRLDDRHQRVFQTVDLFASKILEAERSNEIKVDVWFVVIPDDVWKYCRPKSVVERSVRVEAPTRMSVSAARGLKKQPALFPEINELGKVYEFEVNFRNQLKARMLHNRILTQIVRESTIAFQEVLNTGGRPLRDLTVMQSAISWALSTAAFYKSGGRPWKLADVRPGVCYVGLAFKQLVDPTEGNACCAAQMFLDSGDGIVFKGAIGPWYNSDQGDYHLNEQAAEQLVRQVVEAYEQAHGSAPDELFIHGRTRFNDDEWRGFRNAAPAGTKMSGVRIHPISGLKLYRPESEHPVMRGLAYVEDKHRAYLWSKGFVPRLRTYPGREVPNPLLVDVCRGDADIEVVVADVLRLTKLNYNTCQFADGVPVTLKFADAVGEVLTAGPIDSDQAPLPFRHYI